MTRRAPSRRRAFTLMELLIVIGLIAVLATGLAVAFGRGSDSVSLQAAQANVANVVAQARALAISSGRRTRVLVPTDASRTDQFLRRLVLQQVRDSTASPLQWDTVASVELPDGIYVAPRNPSGFSGLLDPARDWRRRPGGNDLMGSTLFAGDPQTVDLQDGLEPVVCEGISFTDRGTIARIDGAGSPGFTALPLTVMVLPGRQLPPDQNRAVSIQLNNPDAVRGVLVSTYGIPTLVHERSGF